MDKKEFMKKWRAGTYPYRKEFTSDVNQLINSTREECAKEMKTLIRDTLLKVRKRTDDTRKKDLILILMAILAKAIRDKNEL